MLRTNFGGGAHIGPRLAGDPCGGKGLLGSFVLVHNDFPRPLGEELLLFGRKPDISADPTTDIPGCDPGDAHLFTPTAISIAFWHSRMDIVGGAGGMRGRAASAHEGARAFMVSSSWRAGKADISADPALPLGSKVSGDEHPLTTNHQRDAVSGDPNRPSARSDGIFSVSSFLRGVTKADSEVTCPGEVPPAISLASKFFGFG